MDCAGELVHSDLSGKLPRSINGKRYYCSFTDQYTRYINVAGIKFKSETAELFESYRNQPHVTTYFPSGVQALHTDGGGEYKNVKIINHSETCPDTPQHNPFSERVNRTLVEPARVLLEQAGLSKKYWEVCVEYVSYIKNRLPHSALNCSPFEKLTGEKPTLNHIRVFGCAAFVYDENPKSKFHSTGRPGIMLGWNNHGVYTAELMETKQTVTSVHVTFDESSFPALDNLESSTSSREDEDEWESQSSSSSKTSEYGEDSDQEDVFPTNFNKTTSQPEISNEPEVETQPALKPSPQSHTQRRSNRKSKKPDFFGKFTSRRKHKANLIRIPITTSDEPSVAEALNTTPVEVNLWNQAIMD